MMIVPVTPRLFPFLRAITVAVLCTGVVAAAHAADKQTFLGRHGAWYAYLLNEDGARTCYIVSKPIRTRGQFKKRGDVVAFVTHRPKEGERDVVSIQAGYTYKSGSNVAVKIGDKTFSLFTSKDTAWSRNPSEDKEVVHAMIAGNTMDVKGTPLHGSATTDIYSLSGFTAAYKRINRACGLR